MADNTAVARSLLTAIAQDFNQHSSTIIFPARPQRNDFLYYEIGAGMIYAWEVRFGVAGITAIDTMLRVQTGDKEKNDSAASWIMRKLRAAGHIDGLHCLPKRSNSAKEATKFDIGFTLDQCDGRAKSELYTIPVRQMQLLIERTYPLMPERIRLNEAW